MSMKNARRIRRPPFRVCVLPRFPAKCEARLYAIHANGSRRTAQQRKIRVPVRHLLFLLPVTCRGRRNLL